MTENAIIKKAEISIEDHNILTAYLDLEICGAVQGFGGYNLNQKMSDFVRGVLETVGVRSWDKLQGQVIRIKTENGLVKGIGHVIYEEWFYPEEIFKKET